MSKTYKQPRLKDIILDPVQAELLTVIPTSTNIDLMLRMVSFHHWTDRLQGLRQYVKPNCPGFLKESLFKDSQC